MKKRFRLLAILLSIALLSTSFGVGTANAASEFQWKFSNDSKTLYVNADNPQRVESSYKFAFASLPSSSDKNYDFLWSSMNPTIAKVDATGKVDAVSVGATVISCRVINKYSGTEVANVTANVKVKENAYAIKVTNANEFAEGTFSVGDTKTIALEYMNHSGKTSDSKRLFSTDSTGYKSSNENVAVVSENGTVTALKGGTAVISVFTFDSANSDKHTTETSFTISVSDALNPFVVSQPSDTYFVLKFKAPVEKRDIEKKLVFCMIFGGQEIELPFYAEQVNERTVKIVPYNSVVSGISYSFAYAQERKIIDSLFGIPERMELTTDEIIVGEEANIYLRLFDANDVDVTNSYYDKIVKSNIVLSSESVYAFVDIENNNNGVVGTITAYEAGTIVLMADGVRVTTGSLAQNFSQILVTQAKFEPEPVVIPEMLAVTSALKNVENIDFSEATLNHTAVYLSEKADSVIVVALKDSKGNIINSNQINSQYGVYGKVTFKCEDNEFFYLREDGRITPNQLGSALVEAYYTKPDLSETTKLGIFEVEVKKGRPIGSLSVSASGVTMLNGMSPYDEASIRLYIKDLDAKPISVEPEAVCTTTGKDLEAPMVYFSEVAEGEYEVFFSAFSDSVTETGLSKNWYYTISAGDQQVSVKVCVRRYDALLSEQIYTLKTEFNESTIDLAFDSGVCLNLYKTQNDAIIGQFAGDLNPLPENNAELITGNYYYQVLKDGKNITNASNVTTSGNSVNIDFYTIENIELKDFIYERIGDFLPINADSYELSPESYDIVSFDGENVGKGKYTITIYKAEESSGGIKTTEVSSKKINVVKQDNSVSYVEKKITSPIGKDTLFYDFVKEALVLRQNALDWNPDDYDIVAMNVEYTRISLEKGAYISKIRIVIDDDNYDAYQYLEFDVKNYFMIK